MPFQMSPSVGCRYQVHMEALWFSSTNKWIDKLVGNKTKRTVMLSCCAASYALLHIISQETLNIEELGTVANVVVWLVYTHSGVGRIGPYYKMDPVSVRLPNC